MEILEVAKSQRSPIIRRHLGWSKLGSGVVMRPTSPQINGINFATGDDPAQDRAMPMTLATATATATALAKARSCLAALADGETDVNESSRFEHLLIALDQLHPDGPALRSIAASKPELLHRLETAIDGLLDLGGDGLRLERLLADSPRSLWVFAQHWTPVLPM